MCTRLLLGLGGKGLGTRLHHCKRNIGIILRCCHGNRLYLIICTYLCSWLHLPQSHRCMYSWSLQLCYCSWHWSRSHMYAPPVHTHQYLQMVHSVWIYIRKLYTVFVDLWTLLTFELWSTVLLTNAIQSISIQLVSYITAAEEVANGVIASLFTSSICSLAFINVYGAREHTIAHTVDTFTWSQN